MLYPVLAGGRLRLVKEGARAMREDQDSRLLEQTRARSLSDLAPELVRAAHEAIVGIAL
jgi:hypothetical protein